MMRNIFARLFRKEEKSVLKEILLLLEKRDSSDPELLKLIDRLSTRDFPEIDFNKPKWYGRCIHANDVHDFSLFILPRGSIIPLHNHPKMTVYQKVLCGKLGVTTFDFQENENCGFNREGRIGEKLRIREKRIIEFERGRLEKIIEIGQRRANIHSVEALEDAAFVDLISPPYQLNEGEERRINYFREISSECLLVVREEY